MKRLPKISVNKLIKNLLYINKDEVIFYLGNKKVSRLDLFNKILQARKILTKKGFKNKDKVICLLDNSYEQIILFLACFSLGIVWVPVEPKRKGIGLNYIISFIKPKAIFIRTKKICQKNITIKYF